MGFVGRFPKNCKQKHNAMAKILITGAAGFIGSALSKYCLLHKGHEVYGLDQHWSLDHELKNNYWNSKFHRYAINIARQTEDLESIFEQVKPDVTFALHAYASEGRSNHIRSFIHYNNTVSMANVINTCVNHNCKLVFTSSVAVYSGSPPFTETMEPNPVDEYGLSKWTSEKSIQIAGFTQGLDWCIIRPRNVYGPGQNMWDRSRNLFGIWMYNALHGLPLTIYGDGEQSRSFTYIDDIIPCLYRAKDVSGEIINLGSTLHHTVKAACYKFAEVTGYKNIVHIDARHEVKEAFCDVSKSQKLLGFGDHETDLEIGIARMWEWARSQPERPLQEMPPLETNINAHSSLKS